MFASFNWASSWPIYSLNPKDVSEPTVLLSLTWDVGVDPPLSLLTGSDHTPAQSRSALFRIFSLILVSRLNQEMKQDQFKPFHALVPSTLLVPYCSCKGQLPVFILQFAVRAVITSVITGLHGLVESLALAKPPYVFSHGSNPCRGLFDLLEGNTDASVWAEMNPSWEVSSAGSKKSCWLNKQQIKSIVTFRFAHALLHKSI